MRPRRSISRIPGLQGRRRRHPATSGSRRRHPSDNTSHFRQGVATLPGYGRILPTIHTQGSRAHVPPLRSPQRQAEEARVVRQLPGIIRRHQRGSSLSSLAVPSETRRATCTHNGRLQHGRRRRPRAAWSQRLGTTSLLFVKAEAE